MNTPGVRPSDDFLEAVASAGPPLAVDPDSPLPLIEPGAAWFVERGHADVVAMSITRERGANEVIRAHIARVGKGQIMLGFDTPRTGINILLLAFGSRDLVVRRLSVDSLQGLSAQSPACAASLIDTWVVALSDGVGNSLAPAGSRTIRSGTSCSLDTGTALQPNVGVMWFEHLWGSSRFLGQELAPNLTGDPFPVARSGWVAALEPSGLKASVGAEAITHEGYWRGLSAFQASVLAAVDAQARREREASRERLRAKSRSGRTLTESAFLDLRSAVGQSRPSRASADDAGVLAACRIVAEHRGITLRDPHTALPSTSASALQVIAHASNARLRRIRLRGRWWEQECTPFIGFEQDTGTPTAIVPVGGRMHRVDIAAGTTHRMDAASAGALVATAFELWPCMPRRTATLRDILGAVVTGSGKDAALLAATSVMLGVLTLVPALTLGQVFRWVPENSPADAGRFATGTLMAVMIATILLVITRSLATDRLLTRVSTTLCGLVWDRILSLPSRAGHDDRLESLASGLRHDVQGWVHQASALVFHGAALVASAVLLALVLPSVLGSAIVLVMVLAAAHFLLLVRAEHHGSVAQARLKAADAAAAQAAMGISAVRIAAAEDRVFSRWASAYALWAKESRRAGSLRLGAEVVATVAPLAAIAAVVLACRDNASTSVVRLALALPVGAGLIASGVGFVSEIASLVRAGSTLRRLHALASTPPEADAMHVDPGPLRGKIELANVTFRYIADDAPVLDSVSLTVEPGEFVAIVGPSGCGKTTLARIILGLERPEAGAVFIDGHDAEGLDLPACRRQFGVVMQDAGLEPGDILSNVLGSDPDLTHDDALEAARLAGLDRDLESMPMGLHTVVAEGLPTLSGGQRQRILIARALARRPRVIVFDEATSALDNPTQAHVMSSLERLNATRIVIAHRLSTIRNADRIVVLEHGRIVQSGTFDELDTPGSIFRSLIARQ